MIQCSCSSEQVSETKASLSEEYLDRNEKLIREFFDSEESKQRTIDSLRSRCENVITRDSNSCYNAAVLLNVIKNTKEALKYSKKSVELSPNDAHYKNFYYELAKKEDKPEEIITQDKDEENFLKEFMRLENLCKSKKSGRFEIAKDLINRRLLNFQIIERGSLMDCFVDEEKKELKKISNPNYYDYGKHYYKEKVKTDMLHSFWDSEYYYHGKNVEDYAVTNSELTSNWKEFRSFVKVGNTNSARESLKKFITNLNSLKQNQKMEQKKLIAIERAAKLLIEQDEFFKNCRDMKSMFGEDK
ncbi:MAG: hypothetical protein SFU98_20295 [Leptospiraceae bacterium]|nr:hypothetical protein [Leptospiraceae bacterium]